MEKKKMTKILCIDDEKDILSAYKKILSKEEVDSLDELAGGLFDDVVVKEKEKEDFEVFTASQGKEGVDIIRDNLDDPIRVVFVDMRMPPGINGVETAKMIRDLDPKVEIVMVTAYSDLNLKQITKELGNTDKFLFLKKPFDHEEIKQLACNLSAKSLLEESKTTFFDSVSHELNTPLTVIDGFTQLLEETVQSPEDQEAIRIIMANVEILKNKVSKLVYSRDFFNGKIKLDKEPHLVSDLIQQLEGGGNILLKDKGSIEFCVENLSADEMVEADFSVLLESLYEILDNAIKFTEEGKITLKVSREDDVIAIKIKDSGQGIKKENHDKVFETFFHDCGQSAHHGYGLGLSLAKNIVETHGGQINLESEAGKGSEFTVSLPIFVA